MPTKRKFQVNTTELLQKIQEQDKKEGKNNFQDERIYFPEYNEHGVAQAQIRFLMSPDTDIPYVKLFSHGFRGPGGWYIENCPTTLKGHDCPVCKANGTAWNAGDKETARNRARKLNYYSNILILKDPLHPENNGKVFLFRYPKTVYAKIMEKCDPGEDSIEDPVMIFDCYDGANFLLKVKKIKTGVREYPNYDSCQFEGVSSIGTDAEIEKIYEQRYPLSGIVSEDQFKSYNDLERQFNKVVGVTSQQSSVNTSRNTTSTETNDIETDISNSEFNGSDDDFINDMMTAD